MKTLEDYIKLAESATDGPWDFFEVSDGIGVTHEETADIAHCDGFYDGIRGKEEERSNAQFIAASRTLGPAMAKALIEAEEALRGCLIEFDRTTRPSFACQMKMK